MDDEKTYDLTLKTRVTDLLQRALAEMGMASLDTLAQNSQDSGQNPTTLEIMRATFSVCLGHKSADNFNAMWTTCREHDFRGDVLYDIYDSLAERRLSAFVVLLLATNTGLIGADEVRAALDGKTSLDVINLETILSARLRGFQAIYSYAQTREAELGALVDSVEDVARKAPLKPAPRLDM